MSPEDAPVNSNINRDGTWRQPSEVSLTMSAFMISLAVAPLIYGPVSDRFGRKPVVVFGVALFVVASLACAVAQSLPALLICRFVQGVGAASTAMTFAIIRDLFSEATARVKIANVVVAINVVTVIAPTAGAALLTIGGWRLIYMVQAAIGALLLLAWCLDLPRAQGSILPIAWRRRL